KDTRTPAWVGIGSIVLNGGGDWFFMQVLGHWGIALVTSLVSYANTFVLYAIFRRRHGPLNERVLGQRFLVHLLLSMVLGVTLFVAGRPLATTPDSLMSPFRLLHFAAVLALGAGTYLVLGYACKVDEIVSFSRKITRWPSRTV